MEMGLAGQQIHVNNSLLFRAGWEQCCNKGTLLLFRMQPRGMRLIHHRWVGEGFMMDGAFEVSLVFAMSSAP